MSTHILILYLLVRSTLVSIDLSVTFKVIIIVIIPYNFFDFAIEIS